MKREIFFETGPRLLTNDPKTNRVATSGCLTLFNTMATKQLKKRTFGLSANMETEFGIDGV